MDIRYGWVSRARSLLALAGLAMIASGCGDDPSGVEQGPPPTISTIEPATGTVGTDLRITGTNLRPGAGGAVGSLAAAQVDVPSSSEAFLRVPEGVVTGETYDVTFENADGTEVTFPQAFTAVAPTLTFVNGATKPSGNTGSTVIVEGEAFGDAQGTGAVLFSDGVGGTVEAAVASAEDWTDGFILATVPSAAVSGPVFVRTATGESTSLPFTVTQNAAFSPSTIAWTETQALPGAVSGHSASYVPIDDAGGVTVQRVYVVGGSGTDSIPGTNVWHSEIQPDGSLSAWSVGTSLTAGIAHHGMVAATPFNAKVRGSGYLYLFGGIEEKGGEPVGTIQRIPLNEDGSTGAPEDAGTLPAPLHSAGVVIFRSTLYLAGGATTDDSPVAEVYRATIDTLGNIGAWESLPSLPEARAHHQLVGFGGFLYAVGGDTGDAEPNDGNFQQNATKLSAVTLGRIDLRSGLLPDGWGAAGSELGKVRAKHFAVAAGGSLFVSSGLYSGAGNGSSENTFAPVNADGTIGSFGGATGSNTIEAVLGFNLFNARGIAYVDGDGVAHVMVLGGDDVSVPGAKSGRVLFY
ncbi:MAG: hypothetical protein AMS19_03690 [Gemmatimonas sp. SG8_23]|nr:MAG: hypothetical protein AMS19_03690 [Gemmatimonas sp. SG8_23]